jgi:hypothetical protein
MLLFGELRSRLPYPFAGFREVWELWKFRLNKKSKIPPCRKMREEGGATRLPSRVRAPFVFTQGRSTPHWYAGE